MHDAQRIGRYNIGRYKGQPTSGDRLLILLVAAIVSFAAPAQARRGPSTASKSANTQGPNTKNAKSKGSRTKGSKTKVSASPSGKRFAVKLVDVSAGMAYLQIERGTASASPGDSVRIGGAVFEVVDAAGQFLTIEIGERSIRRGKRGSVTISAVSAQAKEGQLPTPKPLASFRGQWPKVEPPATIQEPKPVPLGRMRDARRNRVLLSASTVALFPQSDGRAMVGSARVRGRFHLEPLDGRPLALDSDVAMRQWFSNGDLSLRRGGDARRALRVRQLQASYGTDDTWLASAGRLRSAAQLVGGLDGARVQAAIGEQLHVAAFGGLLSHPINGEVSTAASRFGAELRWQEWDSDIAQSASLVAYGSTFAGELDERRIAVAVDLFSDEFQLGGSLETSFFDSDNVWNAEVAEVSQGGAFATTRFGNFELGGNLLMQRPERSRFLARYLPIGWFCNPVVVAGSPVGEPCFGAETRFSGGLHANYRAENWTASAGGNAVTSWLANSEMLSAFSSLQLRNVLGPGRLDVSAMLADGSFFSSAALMLAVGTPLFDEVLDLTFHYRPSLGRYRADESRFLEHGAGADLAATLSDSLAATASSDFVTGRDVNIIIAQGGLTWRPRF